MARSKPGGVFTGHSVFVAPRPLFAVAATVIGGTSLFGGRGKPRDAIIGALVIAMIPNGIHLHEFPERANEVITGAVLLVAASVDAISRRRAKSR